MKKFLALATLLALVCVGEANATAPAQRWVSDPVRWVRSVANGTAHPSFIDSLVYRRASTTDQTTFDTTAAFPLAACEVPENVNIGGNTAAIDSLPWFLFNIQPSTNSSFVAAADSFGVVAQVSMDGVTWVTTTPTRSFDATRTAGQQIATLVENNSSNGAGVLFKFQSIAPYAAGTAYVQDGATAPSWINLFGWRYIRFLVQSCGATGEYRGFVDHWQSP